MSVTIGIDIGVTGAIAAVDDRGTCSVADMPTVDVPGKRMVRRRIDARALIFMVRQLIPPGAAGSAVIEHVHSMPGDSGPSGFSLGESRGIVLAVLEIARIPVQAVEPATWKRFYGLTRSGKDGSLHKARTLYPSADALLKRKKDHNRADSLLIAHYGLRTLA